jgi:hypothetical protein
MTVCVPARWTCGPPNQAAHWLLRMPSTRISYEAGPAESLRPAPARARAERPPLQPPTAPAGVCRSWAAPGAGVAWDGQVTAGQPGPVQAWGPGHRPAPVCGIRLDCQDSSHIKTCSSWMARRAAAARRAVCHPVVAWRRVGWLAVIKITS